MAYRIGYQIKVIPGIVPTWNYKREKFIKKYGREVLNWDVSKLMDIYNNPDPYLQLDHMVSLNNHGVCGIYSRGRIFKELQNAELILKKIQRKHPTQTFKIINYVSY